MMARYEISDFESNVIEPILPNKSRCAARVDDRSVLNGIFWVLRFLGVVSAKIVEV
jgi:transposase